MTTLRKERNRDRKLASKISHQNAIKLLFTFSSMHCQKETVHYLCHGNIRIFSFFLVIYQDPYRFLVILSCWVHSCFKKRPCLKVTVSWRVFQRNVTIGLWHCIWPLLFGWGRMLWSIHSWADVAQLLLCIHGLKKLSEQWHQHSDFALHECLHLLAVVCCSCKSFGF